MNLRINHHDMDAQLGRSLIACNARGADLGEIAHMLPAIRPGDRDSWWTAWSALAERVESGADQAARKGREVSARQGYLRATEYWRQAIFYQRGDLGDARLKHGFAHHQHCFREALKHLPYPAELTGIPYDAPGTPLMAGVLMRPANDDHARPTIILPCGFDSTMESGYLFTGYMALQRGYNFFTFEGPGQGAMLYKYGVPMTEAFEKAFTPAIDWLIDQEGVAIDKLIVVGRSLGGYLGARGTALDGRVQALVCDPGQYDFSKAFISEKLNAAMWKRVLDGDPQLEQALEKLLADPEKRQFFLPRMRTLGADSVAEYMRRQARFSLADCVNQIEVPTLILESEGDFASQSRALHAALQCPKLLLQLGPKQGVSGHCGGLGANVVEAAIFDWLDEQGLG